jgi:hypothetical protein
MGTIEEQNRAAFLYLRTEKDEEDIAEAQSTHRLAEKKRKALDFVGGLCFCEMWPG